MTEFWKPVTGYESLYEVSSVGNVRSLDRAVIWKGKRVMHPGKVLTPQLSQYGYPTVHISKNGKSKRVPVHKLVASAFIPNPNNKREVNHKNGIKTDNRAENLEWATRAENMKHAHKNGLATMRNANKACEKPVICHETQTVYESASVAAGDLGIPWYSVMRVARGDRPRTHGYSFTYIEESN